MRFVLQCMDAFRAVVILGSRALEQRKRQRKRPRGRLKRTLVWVPLAAALVMDVNGNGIPDLLEEQLWESRQVAGWDSAKAACFVARRSRPRPHIEDSRL